MKIFLKRTGGFAGMTRQQEVDTASLSEQERDGLEKLVAESAFFSLPAHIITPEPPGADRFEYAVTVEDEGKSHTVQFSEGAGPEPLQTLAQQLSMRRPLE